MTNLSNYKTKTKIVCESLLGEFSLIIQLIPHSSTSRSSSPSSITSRSSSPSSITSSNSVQKLLRYITKF